MPSDTDPNAFILKTRPFHTTIEAIAKDKARERPNRPSDVFSLTHATIDDGTGILSRIHEKSMRAIVVHARGIARMRLKAVFRALSRHAHDEACLLSHGEKSSNACRTPGSVSSFSGDFFSSAAFPHRMMIRIDRPNAIVQRRTDASGVRE